MKYKKLLLFVFVLLIFSGLTGSSKPMPPLVFTPQLYVQENCPNGGPVELTLRMVSHKIWHSPDGRYYQAIVKGSIHFSDNVIYNGETEFDFDLTQDTISERQITVEIPKNDTSWVMFRIVNSFRVFQYFVTTKDTLELYDNDPLYHLNFVQGGPHHAWNALKYDSTLPQPEPKSKPKEPKIGEVFLPNEVEMHEANPMDVQREKMRRLEEKPLTDMPSQEIKVGDKWYQRFKGETKFNLVEKQEEKDFHQQYQEFMDSLNAIPDDTLYKACLILDDTTSYRIAKEYFGDELEATAHPDCYHVTSTKDILMKLEKEFHIRMNLREPYDHIHIDSVESRKIAPPQ